MVRPRQLSFFDNERLGIDSSIELSLSSLREYGHASPRCGESRQDK